MAGFPNKTTRTPTGTTNAAPWQTMANAGTQDPTWVHEYFNDFNTYLPSDWVVTVGGTGTSALTAFDGGALLSTTSAGATDYLYYQLAAAGFKIGSTIASATQRPKDTFFKYAGILSATVNTVFYAGLIIPSVTPLAATDGLYIYKAAGAGTLSLVSKIGGVTTTYPLPINLTITNTVFFEIGFHVDPYGNIEVFYNPTTGDNPVEYNQVQNYSQPVGSVLKIYQSGATSLVTSALLSPSFGIGNTLAGPFTLTTDYIVAERHR